MNNTEIVDAEVVVEDDTPVADSPTLAIATQPTHVLRPMTTPDEAGEVMAEYQRTVRAVLDASDYQTAERGRRFVKKSGWRKIAKAYGLSLEMLTCTVERDDAGLPTRAEVWIRAIAPNGQRQDADGYCSADESRFQRGGGRQKLENDLRATATTRAKNRAISDLVGMGEVSAEEIDAEYVNTAPPVVEFPGDLYRVVSDAGVELLDLADADAERLETLLADAQTLTRWIKREGGGTTPDHVGRAVEQTVKMLCKNLRANNADA